jgi:hypothetical protein
MGAVHNSTKNNLVTSANQKQSVTRSSGGNMMVMGDQEGQEYTHFYSPNGNTEVILGQVSAANLSTSNRNKKNKISKLQNEIAALKNEGGDLSPAEQEALNTLEAKLQKEIDGPSESEEESAHPWPSDWPYDNPTDCGSWSYTDKNKASQTMCDSYSYTKGNAYSFTNGDSHSTKHGDSNTTTIGNSFSKTLGTSESFKLSNDFSASLSGSESFTIGAAKVDVSLTGISYKTGVSLMTIDDTFGDRHKKVGSNESVSVGGDYTLKVGESSSNPPGFLDKMHAGFKGIPDKGPGKISLNAKDLFEINSDIEIILNCGTSAIIISPDKIVLRADTIEFGENHQKIKDATSDLSTANSLMSSLNLTSLANAGHPYVTDRDEKMQALADLESPLLKIDTTNKETTWNINKYTLTSESSISFTSDETKMKITPSKISAKSGDGQLKLSSAASSLRCSNSSGIKISPANIQSTSNMITIGG